MDLLKQNRLPVFPRLEGGHRWTFVVGTTVFLSSLYSWLLTAYGLDLLELLPDGALLPPHALAYVLAGVVHAGIVIVWLSIAPISVKGRYGLFVILPPFTFLVAVTLYFSIVSVVFNSKGDSSEDRVRAAVEALDRRITNADFDMSDAYRAKVVSLKKLSDDARQGLDESDVPRCGPKCRGYLRKRRVLIDRYSQLELSIPPDYERGSGVTDLDRQWAGVVDRYFRLQRKKALFEKFANDDFFWDDFSRESVLLFSLDELDRAFRELQQVFEKKDTVDRVSLSVARVNEFLYSMGRNGDDLHIAVVTAVLPEMLNLTLILSLTLLHRRRNVRALERERTLLKKEFELASRNTFLEGLLGALQKEKGVR